MEIHGAYRCAQVATPGDGSGRRVYTLEAVTDDVTLGETSEPGTLTVTTVGDGEELFETGEMYWLDVSKLVESEEAAAAAANFAAVTGLAGGGTSIDQANHTD